MATNPTTATPATSATPVAAAATGEHTHTHEHEHEHLKTTAVADPALNPANQHHHAHHNHSARVVADGHLNEPVYTTGTTVDPSVVPDQVNRKDSHTLTTEKAAPYPAASHSPDLSDHEKGKDATLTEGQELGHDHHGRTGFLWKVERGLRPHLRPIIHAFIFCLFTGWWMASLILHHDDRNWVVPFLLWLAITLRIIFFYVPIRYVSGPIRWVWQQTGVRIYNLVPVKLRTLAGATVTIAAILVGSFASEETDENPRESRAVSLFGLAVFIFMFWATSRHRRHVNWRTVISGMLAQYIIGLFVLRTGVGYDIFSFIAARAGDLLGFASDGVAFLTDADTAGLPWFFIGVIPAIIFFISLVQVLYHIGFLQWFVLKIASFVFWALGVSGAEAVVAAATPFIGQGESAMLVRPFVPHMTNAELHQILTCGFATISGSVLVGYIGLGLNAEILVSSCIMSIPASLALSKLRYPETEETLTAGRVVIPDDDEHKAENALHAFANGAWLGIKIAGSIITSLLCIIALVALINALLTWWGRYIDINDPVLTLQTIFGYAFFPVAFLLGVPRTKHELLSVGRLIAEKVITNEYNAFNQLANAPEYADLSPRAQLIATYALCGFGNIGSLGIQIGILGQLAPSRGGDVSRLALSALITGVFATLSSATIAGLVITDQSSNFSNA